MNRLNRKRAQLLFMTSLRCAAFVCFWALLDLLLRIGLFPERNMLTFSITKYILSLSASAFCFLLISAFLHLLREMQLMLLERVARFFAASLFALTAVSSFFIFKFFGEYLSEPTLAFVVDDPRYILDYLYTYGSLLNIAFILALIGGFYWLLRPSALISERGPGTFSKKLSQRRWKPILLFAVLLVIAATGFSRILKTIDRGGFNFVRLPDTATLLAANRVWITLTATKPRLHSSRRADVTGSEKGAALLPRTIVIIVNESLGRRFTGVLPTDDKTFMPKLTQFAQQSPTRTFLFPKAFSNSSATDVSMPSIATGVAPFEGEKKLHAMPRLWDLAVAQGYRSYYVTSQRLSWQRFDAFFLSPNLSGVFSAERSNETVVNDLGIDDLAIADAVDGFLQKQSPDDKLFLFINTNAMHAPFQDASGRAKEMTLVGDRYQRAMQLLDENINRVFSRLQSSHDRLRDALIIITSDHAETYAPKHSMGRMSSYYDEIMNIPFWIITPSSWAKDQPKLMQNLALNQKMLVSNLDIAPTLYDVLGLQHEGSNQSWGKQYLGASLFGDSITPERNVISLNTNDIKSLERRGFGIYRNRFRLVVSNTQGVRLFDLESDPDEQVNIWESTSPSTRHSFEQVIMENSFLSQIFSDARKVR